MFEYAGVGLCCNKIKMMSYDIRCCNAPLQPTTPAPLQPVNNLGFGWKTTFILKKTKVTHGRRSMRGGGGVGREGGEGRNFRQLAPRDNQ